MIYDVIGDVHGQADKLIGLLTQLGYQHDGQCFQAPPNHQAIFIGDLIDRGSQQPQTLSIVFAMIDHGQALAVMGNHEYNALAYATADAPRYALISTTT
ncbi:MAG: metallophosphoesterase [Moraxella sp.]